jgi:hypothetical protein
MSSVNSFKTYIDVALLSEISHPMSGSSFQIITFIGLAVSREGRAFLIIM